MMGRTHMSAGLLVGGYASYHLDPVIMVPAVVIGVVTSLLPDIDHGSSILGRKVEPLSWFLTHRGITHTLLFAVVVSAVAFAYMLPTLGYTYARDLALVAFAGILSHLILDVIASKSYRGIPLFYLPVINPKPQKVGISILAAVLYTNSPIEKTVFRWAVGIAGILYIVAAFTRVENVL